MDSILTVQLVTGATFQRGIPWSRPVYTLLIRVYESSLRALRSYRRLPAFCLSPRLVMRLAAKSEYCTQIVL
jgi:hypothetical protein